MLQLSKGHAHKHTDKLQPIVEWAEWKGIEMILNDKL